MSVEINVFYRTGNGAKSHIKSSGETFADAAKEYLESVKFVKDAGWVEDGVGGAAEHFLGAKEAPAQSGGISCQFDGTDVEGFGQYTAEHVASSRAKKMGEMGLKAAPVCGPCWNKTYKAKWDAHYASKGKGR